MKWQIQVRRWTAVPAILAVVAMAMATVSPTRAQSPDPPAAALIIDRPTVFPDNRENRDLIERALVQGASHATRVHERLVVTPAWDTASVAPQDARAADGLPTYRVAVTAVQDARSPTITITLSGSGSAAGQQATGVPIMRRWDRELYRAVAQQLFYTWAQAQGFQSLATAEPPVYVDELNLAELVGSTLTAQGANLYPYSGASMPDGGIVVGAMSLAVHLAADFRVLALPGRSLLESGNYTSAMGIASTPAGTVITRPSVGRDLYVYRRAAPEPERIRSPLTGQGAIAALPDGSIILSDSTNRQAIRLDGRVRVPLDLYQEDYSYIPAIAAGPEGNIWSFDTSTRVVQIHSPEGERLESILPAIPIEHAAGTRAMAVGPTGDMLLLTSSGLWRLDRTGAPVWTMPTIGDEARSGLGQMMGLTWDAGTGAIWLVDYMGQRVIRLQEPARLRRSAIAAGGDPSPDRAGLAAFTREILTLNRRLRDADDAAERATIIAEKADAYEVRGSLEMAQAQWHLVLDEDPFHPDALDRIDAIEVALLRREAARLDTQVRVLLEDFGRETARDDYQRTIRVYEQILNLAPGADDIRDAMRSLAARFEERNRSAPRYDLRIAARVEPLFPVLLEQYRRNGAGALRIRNGGGSTVTDLTVTVRVPDFTDGERAVPVDPDLAPGVEAAVPLPLLLNREVLQLQEDLTVPVVVTARYRVDGTDYETTIQEETTLHRRTALVWDDSAKLASFVTPNEEVISAFALRSLAAVNRAGETGGSVTGSRAIEHIGGLSRRVLRAMQLADAVGGYGITYVEDPRSPFSEVQGTATAVDTIRFPRTTLYYRSGDCDDTSALLASIYEAAGLDTAIVTTPGHVMIAVDTQEPPGNGWLYETGTTTAIEHAGTLWLPVETTVLERGFAEAWEEGSALIRRHRAAGEVELLPIREVRDRYPSLPLPPSSYTITEPPAAALTERIAASADYAASLLYENARAQLENQLASRAGSRRIPILNRLGVLHARFGRADRARSALEETVDLRGDYLPGYINLANLELLNEDAVAALAWLERAELLEPESPAVLELMARALVAADAGREARSYVRRLAERAPERADRLSAIVPTSGVAAESAAASGRAAAAGDPMSLLPPTEWLVEEE